jgi:hypothetical protein
MGGLPGLEATAEEVYRRTYPRVRAKNEAYYKRYPEDVESVRRIADHLRENDVRLPDGDRFTVERFQLFGFGLGMGDYAQTLHWMLDEAWDGHELSRIFRYHAMNGTALGDTPIYVVLHESIYAQDNRPTAWAASRLLPSEFAVDASPLLFTGEMIYPWMLEFDGLQPFTEAASLLASYDGWTPLYDVSRLRENRVPVAAAVWHDDMYVDADLSLETAGRLGNSSVWITNEWEHDGGSASGGSVLDRLIKLAADLPPAHPVSG